MLRKTVNLLLLFLVIICLASCREKIKEIVEVSQFSPIQVSKDVEYNDIELPSEVIVTLDNEEKVALEVTWNQDNYNILEETVTLKGTLTLKDNIVNTKDLEATLSIEFLPVDIISTLTLINDFSIFHEALVAKNLISLFDTTDNLTIFAPNNDAFEEFMSILEITKEELLTYSMLEDILLNHIVVGDFKSPILRATAPSVLTSLEGSELSVSLNTNTITINNISSVVTDNIIAVKGVIHEVDTMILPLQTFDEDEEPDFRDMVFERMVEIITSSGLLFDVLFGEGLTIFTPNTEAFLDLMETYSLTETQVLELDILEDILLNHIVKGEYTADDLYLDSPITLTSLMGNSIDVTVSNGVIMINDASVISAQTQDEYGNVFVIDKVLLTAENISVLEQIN